MLLLHRKFPFYISYATDEELMDVKDILFTQELSFEFLNKASNNQYETLVTLRMDRKRHTPFILK